MKRFWWNLSHYNRYWLFSFDEFLYFIDGRCLFLKKFRIKNVSMNSCIFAAVILTLIAFQLIIRNFLINLHAHLSTNLSYNTRGLALVRSFMNCTRILFLGYLISPTRPHCSVVSEDLVFV